MNLFKPITVCLTLVTFSVATFAIRWTWSDLRDAELQLWKQGSQGRAETDQGKTSVLESSKYCQKVMGCRRRGFYYDFNTLHCYPTQSIAKEHPVRYNGYKPQSSKVSTCYNLGGWTLIGEDGYRFKRDPKYDFITGRYCPSCVSDLFDEIEENIEKEISAVEKELENLFSGPPSTTRRIRNASPKDMGVYQTAHSLFGERELKFGSDGYYMIRMMFALIEENDREKSRTFKIQLIGDGSNITIKSKVNIYEAVEFYEAYDLFATVRFQKQCQLVHKGNTIDVFANRAHLHFEPVVNYNDYMNGYCLTRFHPCSQYCDNPIKCNGLQGCIYDDKNSHCIQQIDMEKICRSYSHNKSVCTVNGCHFCCKTSTCSAEANSDCMDTNCGRYCLQEKKCLANLKPNKCTYDSEGNCVDCLATPKLQVAFVVNAGITDNFTSDDYFRGFIKNHIDDIKERYVDPEFAVTSFADWGRSVYKHEKGIHDDEEGCYKLVQSFTKDTSKIKQAEIKYLHSSNPGPKNGPAALAWTTSDERIGWKHINYLETKNCEKRKIVRMLTVIDYTGLHEYNKDASWGNRTETVINHTNQCQQNMPPSLEWVESALNKKRMGLFVICFTNDETALSWLKLFVPFRWVYSPYYRSVDVYEDFLTSAKSFENILDIF